jgi:hypothetical protein
VFSRITIATFPICTWKHISVGGIKKTQSLSLI